MLCNKILFLSCRPASKQLSHLAITMKHIITQNDLLLYLCDEVSYLEKLAIERQLRSDERLRRELDELAALHTQFEDFLQLAEEEIMPAAANVQNILHYSQRSAQTTEWL